MSQMNNNKIGVSIIGGTGFGAGELLRLFVQHPQVTVDCVVSKSGAGKLLTEAHPHLRSFYDLRFADEITATFKQYKKKVIFCALPHGESGKAVSRYYEQFPDAIIIDLSGDLRIKDESIHTKAYPNSPFLSELRSHVSYGMPELFKEQIRSSRLISNPGCLATAAILSLAPLAKIDVAHECWVHTSTGSSGAGKDPKATTHHPVRHANYFSYKPLSHQHVPEIEESLALVKAPFSISFVPHSLPVSRGILSTALIHSKRSYIKDEIVSLFEAFYQDAPFVTILQDGAAELENVIGSNQCEISIATKDNQIVVHAAIDNLVKGMAGQAIQNMNIRLGIEETTGLWFPSLRPI